MPRRKPARSSRAPIVCATSEVEELGVGEAGERHPEDAVALRADELGRDLEREARLPGAARAGEREEARAVREQRDELLELAAPSRRAGSRRRAGWSRRASGAAGSRRRRAGTGARLRSRSFSRCSPRSRTAASRVEEPPGRLGEDDLPAVRGGRDPRRAVDVDPDVALVRHDRLAGVDAHAHADRARLERVARVGGRGHGVRCARERDEERVALRVDLDAVVSRERISQGAAVLGEELGVAGSVLLEKPRRALDVGEQERDGAGRKLGPGHDRAVRSRSSGPEVDRALGRVAVDLRELVVGEVEAVERARRCPRAGRRSRRR